MKREQFIKLLRDLAKERGLPFRVVKSQGKGSHYKLYLGDRATILKDGEINPVYMKIIRRQLGV